jgi:long-chain acyl-CoA synthetase
MTIIEMLEKNARLFPDKTAIIYEDSRISYGKLYERTMLLAGFLVNHGLNKGERVGLLLPKMPESIVSFLGVTAATGIAFPIDYNQPPASIQHVLDITSPSALIVGTQFQSLLSQLSLPCSEGDIIVVGGETGSPYRNWGEILAQKTVKPPNIKVHEEDVVYLNFTSGTTGFPKGAITTHSNIHWNTLASVESMKLTHDDIHLCMFPVFAHPHELFARPLYLGGTIVLIDKISPKTIAKVIADHEVTCMMAVASIYMSLVRSHETNPLSLSSLRIAESGGMHVNSNLSEKFIKHFGIPITAVWGSTETSGIAVANNTADCLPGSMGKPCPYYDIKVLGEDGRELEPDQTGEMVIKGPGVCTGYYGNPEETRRHMQDGWFFTGDLVKTDAEGNFYFVGRKTGMMKVAGLKVFPTEIEEVLNSHPKIAEVAVTKAQDRLHGEVPKAVIVLENNARMSKNDIRKHCEARMSKCKVPRIIEIRTELPKTPGGKISYREL